MSLSKDLLLDPFSIFPTEILFLIADYIASDERDLLHLGLASPVFRTNIVSFRNLQAFKFEFEFQGSYDGRQHPGYNMQHIKAEMFFTQPDNSVFQKAFDAILSRRHRPWHYGGYLRDGDVVVVVAPDQRRAYHFRWFFQLQHVQGFEVFCNTEWGEDLRNVKAVTIFISSSTNFIIPRPRIAILLAPAGTKPVQKLLHLGPDIINVIWPVDGEIGKNYGSVRRLFCRFDRRQKPMELATRQAVVHMYPEGRPSSTRWLDYD